MSDTIFVSNRSWDLRAKRLEGKCLRLYGSSLTWVSILNKLYPAIKEVYLDEGVIIDTEKYRQICREILKEAEKRHLKMPE
jgi:hypothetical protein